MDRRQVTLASGHELSAALTEAPSATDAPTVVFLAGFMAGASEWAAVQAQVAGVTGTISYDRAGYGTSSDPSTAPTTAAALSDLLALLDALGVTAPAVFVAHSWGGTLLRLLARDHPERVAAACLVDASRAQLLSPAQTRAQGTSLRLMVRLSSLGLHRRLMTRALAAKLDGFDAAERAAFLADSTSERTLRTGIRENAAMTDGDLGLLHELEAAGLPDLPVSFVVGKQVDARARKTRAAMLTAHENEAAAHGQARFVVATESGHMVPQQQPGLVAREILELLGGRTHA